MVFDLTEMMQQAIKKKQFLKNLCKFVQSTGKNIDVDLRAITPNAPRLTAR